MSGFTKLRSTIISSSIWNEDDKTRIVWITMLAIKNKDGIVEASVGGLAHLARVSMEDCQIALQKLTAPDLDSRSKNNEGRRVEIVDGGFFVVNHFAYRDDHREEERREYMRNYMSKRRVNESKLLLKNVNSCKNGVKKSTKKDDFSVLTNNSQNTINTNDAKVLTKKLDYTDTDTDTDTDKCYYKEEDFPKNGKSTRIKFIPPSIEELTKYMQEINSSWQKLDSEQFIDYYESVGWLVGGKSKMKSWRAAARRWGRMKKNYNKVDKISNIPNSKDIL